MSERTAADESAGRLNVGCYAGHRYPERPEWVELDGERVDVVEIEKEWREQDRLGFAVKLRDRRRMLLYYEPNDDTWSGDFTE